MSDQIVFVVDDDEAFRDSVRVLCESVGLKARAFSSAHDFLDELDERERGCLVLDIRMPAMSGLELQEELVKRHSSLPVIFMTGHGDVPMAVSAMKKGAFDFLSKPFSHQDLLDSIHHALEGEAVERRENLQREELRERYNTLTPREQEVMSHVVEGQANKVIANRLGISQRTVELHRAQVMDKMQADSLAELVRFSMTGELLTD